MSKGYSTAQELHEEWMKDPAYPRSYDALEEELALTEEFIRARAQATRRKRRWPSTWG